jgi:hypothetical protein
MSLKSFVGFWEIWRHQKDISKLTDLWLCPSKDIFKLETPQMILPWWWYVTMASRASYEKSITSRSGKLQFYKSVLFFAAACFNIRSSLKSILQLWPIHSITLNITFSSYLSHWTILDYLWFEIWAGKSYLIIEI